MSSTSSSRSESKKPLSKKLVPFPITQVPSTPSSQISLTPFNNNHLYSNILQNSKLITPKKIHENPISPFIKKSNLPSSSRTQSNFSSPSKTQYIPNPNLQRIQILEDYQIDKLKKGFHILSDHLFGPENTFYIESYKTRDYYQTILESSGSIKITHKTNVGSSQGHIDFSKAQIFKIISPEEWGGNPYCEKPLKGYFAYPMYSYYDYQEAWFKTFLVRNFSHSWFIFFDKNFNYQYPRWFINWYRIMGLLPKCLPEEINTGFSSFKKYFVQEISEFEYLLQFTIIFKIPWIITWTYQYQEAQGISPPWLNRQYRAKWWDKFEIIQANEKAVINHYQLISGQQVNQEKFIKHEESSDSNLIARIISAAESSQEDVQKLLQDIRRFSSDSEGSPSKSISRKTNLFQDAQDPFDDPYED